MNTIREALNTLLIDNKPTFVTGEVLWETLNDKCSLDELNRFLLEFKSEELFPFVVYYQSVEEINLLVLPEKPSTEHYYAVIDEFKDIPIECKSHHTKEDITVNFVEDEYYSDLIILSCGLVVGNTIDIEDVAKNHCKILQEVTSGNSLLLNKSDVQDGFLVKTSYVWSKNLDKKVKKELVKSISDEIALSSITVTDELYPLNVVPKEDNEWLPICVVEAVIPLEK